MNVILDTTRKKVDLNQEIIAITKLVNDLWVGDKEVIETLIKDAFYEGFNKNSARLFSYVLNDLDENEIWTLRDKIDFTNKLSKFNSVMSEQYNSEDIEEYLIGKYPYLNDFKIQPKFLNEANSLYELHKDDELKNYEVNAINSFSGTHYKYDMSLPEKINVYSVIYNQEHNGFNPIHYLFFSIFEQGKMLSKHINSVNFLDSMSKVTPKTIEESDNSILKMVYFGDENEIENFFHDFKNQQTKNNKKLKLK